MSENVINALEPLWWRDPWWEDPIYQQEHSATLDQILSFVAAARTLFDEEWMRRAIAMGPPNAIIPILCGGKGLWPFQNLMWLGRLASLLVSLPTVHRPLRDLIGPKSRSTLFEMEVASWFVENGWDVEFLKPQTAKTPDIGISKGGLHSAIECKHFKAEKWEDWAEVLSMNVIQRIAREGLANAPSHEILFEPRLSDLASGEDAVKAAIQEEIAERICAAAKQAFATDPPLSQNIPGIARINLRPELPGSQLSVGGIEVSPQGKTRRIITNGVLEAAQQLRVRGPGAVVVHAGFTPPESLLDVALRALNRADSSLLASVAVVFVTASYGCAPVVWRNPAMADSPISGALADAFETIIVKPRALF